MALSNRQKLALNRSTATVNLWYGSVRSSKTYGQIHDFIARMSMATGQGTNLVVGYSTNTVWRNIFQPIVSRPEFAAIAPHLRYRQNAPTGTLFGRPFSVVGANNEASWLAIQGLTVENAWGDEATGWPESFYDMLYSRLSLPNSRALLTCNPGTGNHYLKRRVIDSNDPDVHVEKFLLEENPTLPPEYVARLHRQYTGLFYRRMILAEWVAAEGAVYQTWDPDTMVRELPDPSTLRLIATGVDYGVTNPSAGAALALSDDGVLWVVDEWDPNPGKDQRLTDVQLAESYTVWENSLALKYGGPPTRRYADPSAASFIEEMRGRRLPFVKASNKVVDGINTVASNLDGQRLLLAPGTPALQAELSEYRWDPKATERGEDKPVKANDHHCLVGDTLVTTPTGAERIDRVCPGDMVLTRDGYREVLDQGMTDPSADTITIELDNGTQLTGTGNHPVWVDGEGWVPLGSIKPGDHVQQCVLTQSPTEVSGSAATQTHPHSLTAATTRPVSQTDSAELTTFTARSGNEPTGSTQSRRGTTSTTGTATTSTTTHPTLNWSQWRNTPDSMPKSGETTPSSGRDPQPVSPAQRSNERQPNGTPPQKGSLGTGNMANDHGRTGSRWEESANTAGNGTKPAPNAGWNGSAQTGAGQRGGAPAELTTLSAPAQTVGAVSPSTSTPKLSAVAVRVRAVYESGTSPVYNLTVAGNHEYLANGIVVHNCDALRYAVYSSKSLWRNRLRPAVVTAP